MTGQEPRRPSTRGRLRPVPEPDRQPPTTWRPRRRSSARSWPPDGCWPRSPACSRRPTSTGQPTGPSGGPSCAWPTAGAHRPGDRAGGAGPRRRAGRCGRGPFLHPGRGRAHRGQRRPLRPAGRRDGPAPPGDRPGHPPGPLRRRPGRARRGRRRAGRHHDRPTVGAAGSRPSRSGPPAVRPRSRSRCCPAGSSTWLRSPPPPRPHRSGRHARPGRAGHRRRRRGRGPTPARLA